MRHLSSFRPGRARGAAGRARLLFISALAITALAAVTQVAPALSGTTSTCGATGNETLAASGSSFQPGDTVHLSGSGYGPGCTVSTGIVKPDGSTAASEETTDATGNLSFDYAVAADAASGTYGANVYGDGSSPLSSASFAVGSGSAGGACAKTGNESAQTNQSSYSPGSEVRVSGTGYNAECGVTVKVTKPDGSSASGPASTDLSGNFAFDYSLSSDAATGTYNVDVLGANDEVLAQATFSVATASGLPCAKLGTETLSSDKNAFVPGQTVELTGSGYGPLCLVTIQVGNGTGTPATGSVATDIGGGLSYNYSLPSDAAPGDYTAAALGGIGSAETLASDSFTVNAVSGAHIETGKDDYNPGETVILTGGNWAPGETVNVVYHRESGGNADTTSSSVANSEGEISNTALKLQASDAGVAFTVAATGQGSGQTATANFNDSAAGDCYRTATGLTTGNWNATSTWESATAPACTTWVAANLTPTSTASTITIRSGATVSVTAAVTVDQVTVASGGDLEVNTGVAVSLANGAGFDLFVDGAAGVTGTITQAGSSAIEVRNGGALTVKSGGVINGGGGNGATTTLAQVDSGGSWTVNSGGSYAPGGTNAVDVQSGGAGTFNGTFAAGTSVTFNGTVTASTSVSVSAVSSLQIGGTVTMTGGTLSVSRGNGGGLGSINNGGSLILQGSSVLSLGNVGSYSIASGGTLDAGASTTATGNATLATAAGANVKIASTTGVNGNILSQKSFVNGTNWTFDGSAAQSTNGLPSVVNDLTINNSGGNVTMSSGTNVNGNLALTSGDLVTGSGNTLTMPAAGTTSGTTDVVGNFLRQSPGTTARTYGNPNNMITAGTGPTSITVNLKKSAPSGKSGAVTRTYTVSASGNPGTSTLQLHYLNTELNGNTGSTLDLWQSATEAGTFTDEGATGRTSASDPNNSVSKSSVAQAKLLGVWTPASPSSATLLVKKHVVNDNGGTAPASAWTLNVASNNDGTGTGSAPGSESGTSYTLQPGKQYSVTESATPTGYSASPSDDCAIASATAGASYTCTITNDDQPAKLVVAVHVINDNGGTKQASDINVSFVHAGNPSPASFPGDEAGTTVTMDAGSYELSTNDPGPGYFGFTNDPDCSPGPIANGETKHCTINFDDKPGTLEVDKVVVNDNGGTNKATDFKFSVNNGSSVAFDAGADDQHGSKSVTVDAGTYTVSEDAASGYTPDYDNCTGVHVDNGQTVTCTITNDDQPAKLTVIKTVVKDNGGTAGAGDWQMDVTATNPSDGAFPGEASPGTEITIDAGAFSVDESGGPAGYSKSLGAGCTGTAEVGGTYTCEITNDDQPAKLTVIKTVVKDNGGTAGAGDWQMDVTATNPSDGAFPGEASPGTEITIDAGAFSVDESGGPAGYSKSLGAGCTGTAEVGGTYTCEITNDDQPAKLTVIKHVSGGSATASQWTMNVTGGNVLPSSSFAGAESPGTTVTLDAGGFSVGESGGPADYLPSGSGCTGTIGNGESKTCTMTNTFQDADGDGIGNSVDCTSKFENKVVDPANLTGLTLGDRRFKYLKDAVAAASDNDVISMYANTTENVVINNGKDLLIEGCGHKIAAANSSNPTIDVQAGAGANDGNTGAGEADIQIQNLTVMGGSVGINVATVKTAGKWTLLKGFRADNNTVGVWITGSGNEVSGANSISSNGQVGVKVTGSGNSVHDSRIYSNGQQGIYATSSNGNFSKNKVGDAGQGNGLAGSGFDGVYVSGGNNTVNENDVFANGRNGISIYGNSNTINKNDVGDKGKGNGQDGIYISGNNNTAGVNLNENDVFANGRDGISVNGNGNVLTKNASGDKGKQNVRDGFYVSGNGNKLTENTAYANGRDGFDILGGTAANPNVLLKNVSGDDGKGNGRNGFSLANLGNGTGNPIELEQNTAQGNVVDGINVAGTGWQLKNNVSGGSSGQKNGQCAFNVVAGNFNAQGNKANNNLIPGALNSAFPTGCTK